jgi:hypothetical protein
LEVVRRAGDVDPAEAHRLILCGLQTFDALAEAERGYAPLPAVSLAAVINRCEVACWHGVGCDCEIRAAVDLGLFTD